MRIGELARETGVTTKTIRYYESIDLISEPARTPSGYRDYAADAIERIEFIRDAQASGLTLAEISSVLELKGSGQGSCAHTTALLERHLQEIDLQIERLLAAKANLTQLTSRAVGLDPRDCTDPNRCQIISSEHASVES